MNLLLRLIRVLIVAFLRPGLGPDEGSRVPFRVWLNDLDFNMHMNNGRYLTIMDLGRVDMMVRNGFFKVMRREGWMPVVAGQTIRYRRALGPAQRYDLLTDVVCWDDRFIYMVQRFESRGELAASAIVKAAILKGGRTLPTTEVRSALGLDTVSPPMPPEIAAWAHAETAMRDAHADDSQDSDRGGRSGVDLSSPDKPIRRAG